MRARHVTTATGAHYGVTFFCPACNDTHTVKTLPAEGGWSFNGDYARPTLSPSILVHPHKTYATVDGKLAVVDTARCHAYVRGGRIVYLADSTHKLAGRTVELPEIPEGAA